VRRIAGRDLDQPGLEGGVDEHVVAVELEAVLVVDDDALPGRSGAKGGERREERKEVEERKRRGEEKGGEERRGEERRGEERRGEERRREERREEIGERGEKWERRRKEFTRAHSRTQPARTPARPGDARWAPRLQQTRARLL
jgi:hypothetical protein